MVDFLIVGSGFFGSVFAHEMKKKNKSVLVIDKREHTGGNCYNDIVKDIVVHKYGPHIFNTSSDRIWEYMNNICPLDQFTYSPVAKYNEEIYSLPFNMWTFNQLWGVKSPDEAEKMIKKTIPKRKFEDNLEDYAISQVGNDVYNKLIKGYSKKQWQSDPKDLPSFIIKRIPIRLKYDNNYFKSKYTGIPKQSYNEAFKNLLEGVDIQLGVDYFNKKEYWDKKAKIVLYTGRIDEFYNYKHGNLDYRSLRFDHKTYKKSNKQGVCVINHTCESKKYTRTIEHKHFKKNNLETQNTIVSYEYPIKYDTTKTPYYPINNNKNQSIFRKYKKIDSKSKKFIFGGRLASYQYYNMDQVIGSALRLAKKYE